MEGIAIGVAVVLEDVEVGFGVFFGAEFIGYGKGRLVGGIDVYEDGGIGGASFAIACGVGELVIAAEVFVGGIDQFQAFFADAAIVALFEAENIQEIAVHIGVVCLDCYADGDVF